MKFVIATQEFNYLVNKCLSIVSQKSTMPILSNFLIQASNGELAITATDLAVGVRCFTQAKILEEGATTVPAKTFSSLIRELTALNVEIRTNSHDVTEIIADSSRFKIHGMNSSEFPSLPDLRDATKLKIPQDQFKDMLFRTAFAVSRDETRYTFTGVCMQIANGKAIFTGTDGKKLAKSTHSIDFDPSFSGTYIIPIRSVEELLKTLEEEGTVSIYLMDDKIAVENDNSLFITKLLSGEYPDVQQVIPTKHEIVVSLHREELISLLRQVSLFTENAHHSVKFSLEKGELKLSANTKELGEGKVSMPVDYHQDPLEIAFNPTYFIEILRHTKGEAISLELTDSFNPGLIKDGHTPNPLANSLFVLMPMRLSTE
ncbi:MAG TPA: DNA polymerase III subunit beta [Waddliaceae bacterium]